jgi:predicted ATP-grasp superfamily ATP-dependent carboligase
MGEIRELRMKVDKLSKQCKLDEEMIEKMEERIKRLSVEVARKNA